ncbi:hypothetical protein Rhopal_002871-T1 [Rhodotorula paludigena]|uniref:Chitin synthase n=1 Tax=Rhodotorula paludigena TaxID=86838 RepID=A0AAV5GK98_9BASI|nr:hypothetical protein Rhopal_002871-T1 [Rhodotorula paludigena]
MRRRQSQDFISPELPFARRPDAPYGSPTSAHQFSPAPSSSNSPRPHLQRPQGFAASQPSYHSHRSQDPYDDHTNLYGYYADNDAASTHSHTALHLPLADRDYYSSPPPLPSPHFVPAPPQPQLPPGAPSYPPMSPAFPPPSPAYPYAAPYTPMQMRPVFSPTFQPGQYYEQSSYYAQARQDVLKRREKKRVALTDGHLVLDLPVPRSIQQLSVYKGEDLREESGKLRYTAVTDDPDDFFRERYRLRQVQNGRETELFICCTMYNEDDALFVRTFTSVIKNIQHLVQRTKSRTWGAQSWKKIVVCVVSDGRAKIHPRTLKILGLYGAYQDGVMKDEVEGKDVQAHLFEYTSQVVVDDKGNVSGGIAPIQIVFCLKEQNQKKLNSHRWAFNAFAQQLRPNVVILLDIGTKPGGDSIYKLWKEFDRDSKVGGACGEITVDLGRGGRNLLNPLVAAQNFEYKMSNILDKSLESVFGFVSVLPGAFSAYRYRALVGRPLEEYFLGEKMHQPGSVASLSESNKFLAEDRILCFELVAKRSQAWVLRYVRAAHASTDVPDSVAEFISQRRRWMNGAFFASLYSTTRYHRIWSSGHSFLRKIWMSFIFLYNLISILFSFIGLSSFYLAFYFLCSTATADASEDPFGGHGSDVISVANYVYIATLGVCIVCSLGNKPAGSRVWYLMVMSVFAILFCIAVVWVVYKSVPHTVAGWKDVGTLFESSAFRNLAISLGSTLGLYLISSIMHLDPWHCFTCFIQYMLLLPSYMIVLTIYSFSNLHDLAWGTKGDTTVKDLGSVKKTKGEDGKELLEVAVPTKEDDIDELWVHMRKDISTPPAKSKSKRSADQKQVDHYANIRTNTLLFYLGVNLVIAIVFSSTNLWKVGKIKAALEVISRH